MRIPYGIRVLPWIVGIDRIYVLCKEHLFSGDPRIQFDIYPSSDKLNYYEKNYENLKDEGTRTIGGVELKARSYKNVGLQWTEYYGEVPGGGWLSIKISKVDRGTGSEGDAVLNSISFK